MNNRKRKRKITRAAVRREEREYKRAVLKLHGWELTWYSHPDETWKPPAHQKHTYEAHAYSLDKAYLKILNGE